MKPKFKKGDKLRFTLEFTVQDISVCGRPYYDFGWAPLRKFGSFFDPNCAPLDKKAKLVKPAKKKAAKKGKTK